VRISDLETPSLLIDLDVLEKNLHNAAAYTAANNLRFRPHTKTHKIPALARKQLDLGAVGLTVAKIGEAEVFLQVQPPDFLIAYPVVGEQKLNRLMQVAKRVPTAISLDSLEVARPLSEAGRANGVEIGVLVEMDVGFGRVGVRPSDVPQLVAEVRRLPFLKFEGIAFFPGHISPNAPGGLGKLESLGKCIHNVTQTLELAGSPARVVSGGSTPTLFYSHLVSGMNEIRSGTYIFNDKNTVVSGGCLFKDCAAFILTTVVSVAKAGQVIVDCGSKTIGLDPLAGSNEQSFGHILDGPDASFCRMNEEHGYIDITRVERHFQVGDRIRIIPNHICVAVNLQEEVYGFRGDSVEEIWKVDARAKVR
jgi:D-serine deaminase-like pyridoxal phosphate-dependent protein